jgi:hypothetical protein
MANQEKAGGGVKGDGPGGRPDRGLRELGKGLGDRVGKIVEKEKHDNPKGGEKVKGGTIPEGA